MTVERPQIPAWRDRARFFSVLACVLVPVCAGSVRLVLGGEPVLATQAEVSASAGLEAEFRLDLTASVAVEITTLTQPHRVVVELPEVGFRIDPAAGAAGAGVVTGFRVEALPDNRGRVIIDTAGPVRVTGATFTQNTRAHGGVQLVVGLSAAARDPLEVGAAVWPAGDHAAVVKPAVYDDGPGKREPQAKPVIMIDPGHGGIDPGAIGVQRTTEKAVVLAVARELKAALSAGGHYDVRLTRADDVFIALDSRVEQSLKAKADLFISLHADAIEDSSLARSIHGASIYTLSEKASDEQAALVSDKENAADLAAGVESATVDGGAGIKGILYDLMNRETAAFSHLLSRSIAEALGKTGGLAREPERAAAFRVLKQAHAPSVLIELGFLSNPDEEQRMGEAWWQKQTARALAAAIEGYFANRAFVEANRWAPPAGGRLPP